MITSDHGGPAKFDRPPRPAFASRVELPSLSVGQAYHVGADFPPVKGFSAGGKQPKRSSPPITSFIEFGRPPCTLLAGTETFPQLAPLQTIENIKNEKETGTAMAVPISFTESNFCLLIYPPVAIKSHQLSYSPITITWQVRICGRDSDRNQ